ncbi:hypothetical protein K1719_027260 [Acacia pycnantha]|nr:hypothetical protein K1719_027260 [Acacia pycnantha]
MLLPNRRVTILAFCSNPTSAGKLSRNCNGVINTNKSAERRLQLAFTDYIPRKNAVWFSVGSFLSGRRSFLAQFTGRRLTDAGFGSY